MTDKARKFGSFADKQKNAAKKSKDEAPAETETKTETEEAPPAKKAKAKKTTAVAKTNGKSKYLPAIKNAGSALLAHTEGADEIDSGGGGGVLAFPLIELVGGSSGGTFRPHKLNSDADKDAIDESRGIGQSKVKGVYLSHRWSMFAYPHDFDNRTDEDKPVFGIAIPDNRGDVYQLLRKAANIYKWCSAPRKRKLFDEDVMYATGETDDDGDEIEVGLGHMKPMLEVMLWVPDLPVYVDDEEVGQGGIVIVCTPAHADSMEDSTTSLAELADENGAINPMMVHLVGETEEVRTWQKHRIDFRPQRMDDEVEAAFHAWYEEATQSEVAEAINEWMTGFGCDDDDILARLSIASKLSSKG